MIKVNLLSTTPGVAPPKEWLPKEQRSALMGLGMLFVTAVGVGGYWWYLKREHNSIDTKIATAEAELVRLKEASTLVDRATTRKAELAERLALIERLRADKNGPVTLLETVSYSTTEGLWLTEIKQTGAFFQIDGRALSMTSITDFAGQLQNSGIFKGPVEILSAANELVDEHAVVKFSLKAESLKMQPPPAAPATAKPNTITSSPAAPAPAAGNSSGAGE
jgi:type IV pilus assembly protein PilN